MSFVTAHNLKYWLKNHPSPWGPRLFVFLKQCRNASLPTPRWFNKSLYIVCTSARDAFATLTRVFVYTPAFKGRLQQCGQALYLYGGLPFISGPVSISVGNQCRISGQTTFSGRSTTTPSASVPQLIIGNNVGIGWQVTMAIGQTIELQDNVRIAGRCQLFGYSGHPLDAVKRAKGEPDEDYRVGSIVLEQDVWLGSDVTVQTGVRIGQGTIVAAGSVVTHDLPPFVIAAGSPAKVIKSITADTASSDADVLSVIREQKIHQDHDVENNEQENTHE
ncbi:acetyltransferase [Vibrio sp. 10N.286.49.C2]|uniref:acyltransferase n=1 Tax=unclassified Vibrio TaxID=2614977 RepID=UPI000C83182F|nr:MULTISPECIES: acyltransferase [unclassified Vibrio]PMH31419.1 acetyltransferase [Vibrio sp. 10N.286.49.C2]PMH50440.1 acetyltransferase [Vibrio sp. 10N.286.49.B1]PMH78077.1 acetyltransferase [Vibrio sp. 10N.286.48.B7]